jgi:hypothetical protein
VFVLELNFFGRRQLVPIAIVRVLFFGFSGAMYLFGGELSTPAASTERR